MKRRRWPEEDESWSELLSCDRLPVLNGGMIGNLMIGFLQVGSWPMVLLLSFFFFHFIFFYFFICSLRYFLSLCRILLSCLYYIYFVYIFSVLLLYLLLCLYRFTVAECEKRKPRGLHSHPSSPKNQFSISSKVRLVFYWKLDFSFLLCFVLILFVCLLLCFSCCLVCP